jgi:uncharacterized protein
MSGSISSLARMHNLTRYSSTVLAALLLASHAFAAVDPTSEQIYQAAQSGHLQQAEQMIGQVLENHPQSGKAHYVAAEVYAKEGRTSDARRELNTAQELAPGLPFANTASVAALEKELTDTGRSSFVVNPAQSRSGTPWALLAILAAGIGLLWFLIRGRREPSHSVAYSPYSPVAGSAVPGMAGGIGNAPLGGSGIGSGIAGGLASSLAVGAGVVAGEELARHFLDSDRNEPVALARAPVESTENSTMGGDDFGLNSDSSWDDNSSGVGDDWT